MGETMQAKRLPKYAVIHDYLLQRINDGTLAAGDQLPTCSELCGRFGVSAITANRALDELVAAGLAEQYAGRGSFVAARTPGTTTVGLLLSMVGHHPVEHAGYDIGTVLLRMLDDESHRRHAHLVTRLSASDDRRESDAVDGFRAQKVDALIATPLGGPLGTAALQRARADGLSVVFLDRAAEGVDAPTVTADNRAGGRRGTARLLELGPEPGDAEPFFLGYRNHPGTQDERLLGFQDALSTHGIDPDGRAVLVDKTMRDDETMEDVTCRGFAERLPGLPRRFSLFALNAIALAGAWRAIADSGRGPEDVALACFDDPGRLVPEDVPLVKVIQPLKHMAGLAMAAAFEPGALTGVRRISPTLEVRAGAAAARK